MANEVTIDGDGWVNFDVTVSIAIAPALAERMRVHFFDTLRSIEGDDPEVLAIEQDLPALWARMLDRQYNPFAEIHEHDDNEMDNDYRFYGSAA